MLIVETIAKVRRDHFVEKKPIKAIVRDRKLSRNTVRKIIRSGETSFSYERRHQPRPQLDRYLDELKRLLEENVKTPARSRRTIRQIWDQLQEGGFEGGYDSVLRFAQRWESARASGAENAFIPLWFAPGEAFQFDWSHEDVLLAGMPMRIKVAHVRLCHSRMFLVVAYPREKQEMVFDAHDRAFSLFGGACRRGIYDNMKTAVDAVFVGKKRTFNRRFEQMCSHYLVDPVACTPRAGWEKGQVENQVGNARKWFFSPRPRFQSLAELNAWLSDRCIAHAKAAAHPEIPGKTIWEVFEEERPVLIPYPGAFDGWRETSASASKTCLVRFDRNRYSVAAKAAAHAVQVRAYAERVVILLDGEVVGEHARQFGRGKTEYDPWHYLPALVRKPGALRNGAPFKNWELPTALARVRRRLASHDDGDKQFVGILAAILDDGLEAVEAACGEALACRLFSRDVVLNILARQRQGEPPPFIATPEHLTLEEEPVADCARYDRLRDHVGGENHGTP
jgi:transposase